ncbi:MAG TPA: hypothetical protein PLK90_00825 [Clostridiales bacterium]|nr:hypothetical protein [Clostridiales bacterium]HQP68919.1 hypothetical protein [Clostridiales bacterium]
MLVKSLHGTANNTCECKSWIDHWEKYTDKNSYYCSVNSCLEKATDGAHVVKVNSDDRNWYIVPLCHAHNLSDNAMDIGSTTLAPANVAATCG